MKYLIILFACLITKPAAAQIIGLDIHNDFGSIGSSIQRETTQLSKVIGSQAYLPAHWSKTAINKHYNCVNIELVLQTKPNLLKTIFPRHELKLGLAYYSINSTLNN